MVKVNPPDGKLVNPTSVHRERKTFILDEIESNKLIFDFVLTHGRIKLVGLRQLRTLSNTSGVRVSYSYVCKKYFYFFEMFKFNKKTTLSLLEQFLNSEIVQNNQFIHWLGILSFQIGIFKHSSEISTFSA